MHRVPLIKNMLVRTLLDSKEHKGIESLMLDGTTVRSSAQFMKAKKVSCVVFMKDGKPAGIMTERDVSNALADHENASQMPVSKVMTPWEKVKTIHVRSTIGDTENDMRNLGVRHGFAVNDKGELEGVFSQRDINDAHHRNEKLIEIQGQ